MGVPEVKKDFEWCPHCIHTKTGAKSTLVPGSGGCLIYINRPQRCRDFSCQWLLDERFGDYWYPARSKIIVDTKTDGKALTVCFVVDPTAPGRWREEPWFSDIKKVARTGLEGRPGWTTVILVKDERIVVGL